MYVLRSHMHIKVYVLCERKSAEVVVNPILISLVYRKRPWHWLNTLLLKFGFLVNKDHWNSQRVAVARCTPWNPCLYKGCDVGELRWSAGQMGPLATSLRGLPRRSPGWGPSPSAEVMSHSRAAEQLVLLMSQMPGGNSRMGTQVEGVFFPSWMLTSPCLTDIASCPFNVTFFGPLLFHFRCLED